MPTQIRHRGYLAFLGLSIVTVLAAGCLVERRAAQRSSEPDAQARVLDRSHRNESPAPANLALRERDEDDDEERGGEATGGIAAMEFRRMMRLDSNGRIEQGALLRAKEQADDMFQPRDAGIWSWEWLGPGNIGGRMRAICFTSTTTGYVGGVCGGIWKTTDGGNSWSPMSDFLPSMSVVSIFADPTNSSRLYASTGEAVGSSSGIPGAGVFRTTTSGIIWTQLPQTATWQNTMRLATVPGTQTIYAANESGVFRSTDTGDTWTQVLFAGNAMDVDVDPNNTQRVIVGTATDVYVSTTGGGSGTYTLQTTGVANKLPSNGGTCEVAVGASGYMWVAMDRNQGELYRSTDGGSTWTLRNTGTNWLATQGNYGNALWASPDDNTLVVVGGIDVWRSTNGGTTLTQISDHHNYYNGLSAHADQHIILANTAYSSANRRLYFGNDAGIQTCSSIYTVTQTTGWTNLANNLGITQFYHAAVNASGNYILGGAQDNSTCRYRPADGTDGWYVPFTGDGGFCAINPINILVQYAEWQNLNFMKSVDGGNSFDYSTNGLTDAGNSSVSGFIAPFEMDPFNPTVLVAGSTSIWRTANSAASWSSIRGPITNNPKATIIAFAPSLQNRIWVGYSNGRLSRTTTNVSSWTDLTTLPSTGRAITDIAVNPNNSNEAFVTVGGYETDTVFHTTDEGATWSLRTGSGGTALPAVQVNTITYHPQNTNWIFVGTDIGIFASEDKGQTWSQTPRNTTGTEGPTSAEVDDLIWQNNDYLIAATHGRSMWRARPSVYVYVDAANNTGNEDGTAAHPFNTVQEGISAAGPGTTISIQAGDYNESLTTTFNKRGRVVGTGGLVRIH